MKRDKVINRALSIFFTILSLAWIYPVFMIALNSFKKGNCNQHHHGIRSAHARDVQRPRKLHACP